MVDRWQKVQDNFAPALDLGPQEAGSGTPGDAPQRSKFARQVIRVAFYGLMWTVGFSINISGSLLAQRVKGPLTSLQVESIAVGAAFTGCIVMSAAMVADVFNFARENRAFTYGDVLGATFEQRIIAKYVELSIHLLFFGLMIPDEIQHELTVASQNREEDSPCDYPATWFLHSATWNGRRGPCGACSGRATTARAGWGRNTYRKRVCWFGNADYHRKGTTDQSRSRCTHYKWLRSLDHVPNSNRSARRLRRVYAADADRQ